MNDPSAPRISQTLWVRGGKRVADVLMGVGILVAVSPVLLIAAVLIKTTSAGPLIFVQERSGRDGCIFKLKKLRTMTGGRKPDPKELVPLEHPDITPVGWFLRRTKIDELPQLLHVISGEMSLIGPRPTLPDQVAAYDAFRRQRLLLRPGISGLAQVNCNAGVSWDERILYDIAYVRRCGFLMDLGILARTVFSVVLGEERMTRPFDRTSYASAVDRPPGYPRNGMPSQ